MSDIIRLTDKIDKAEDCISENKIEIALINTAINGNGSIGMKDQLKYIRSDVKKLNEKVDKVITAYSKKFSTRVFLTRLFEILVGGGGLVAIFKLLGVI